MKKLFRLSQKNPPVDFPVPQAVANSALPVGLQPRFTVPPVPHPTPYHRLAVLAAEEGLLLRPIIPGVSRPKSHVCISWGDLMEIKEISDDKEEAHVWDRAAVVLGVLGSLKLNSAFLFSVLDARNTVYGVKSVSAIPLQESRARSSISSIAVKYNQANLFTEPPASDTLDSHDLDNLKQSPAKSVKVKFADNCDVKTLSPRPESEFRPSSSTSSIASSLSSGNSASSSGVLSESDEVTPMTKVLPSRLSFWSRLAKRQSIGSSLPEEEELLREAIPDECGGSDEEPSGVLQEILESTSPLPATTEERQNDLDEKILKECIREFTKGGMYFAYNFDITTSLQHKQHEMSRLRRRASSHPYKVASSSSEHGDEAIVDILAEPCPTLPLWRRVSKQFWWNESMLQPFIDAGLHSYVLPVMQGFYQVASFHVPREPEVSETGDDAVVDYIIVSRRSRDRAGLRYQRRGIDDDANVANFVETEAVVRVEREGISNIFSHIQIRGSIPLFWTQSGYNLKPPPILSPERTHQQNSDALRRHFTKTIPRYGPHTVINLAEQHGKEAIITNAYREYVNELCSKDVRYTEYDFHKETRNIGKLIQKTGKTFDAQGFTWISGSVLMSEQKSVFRVNCIDCLDRTNVVQSAFARHVLNRQLGAVALLNPTDAGRSEIDVVFNDVWANNGDAISRAYDWFSQAVIDFMLGYRTLSVFSEFLLKLQSTDPRERIRIDKIRAEAIATSMSRVLSEGESLLSGWTLLSPAELNTRISDKLEEKVVLLSVDALYIVSYDYTLEKVIRYSRVPLGQITSITKGAYILSTLEEGSRDPLQNYGFMVHYLTSGETTRVTSYSLRNSAGGIPEPLPSTPSLSERPRAPMGGSSVLSRMLTNTAAERGDATSSAAFKALPVDPARAQRTTGSFEETADELSWAKTCKEAIDIICNTIHKVAKDAGVGNGDFVIEHDIVSLEDAQQTTTVVAKMEYGLKRLLWLGS
ncbi:SacI homology domain-containing protein [Phellopilus nigrolimitatus]|nr:SacI homology domain-containing protein [Phellopilus nigrolimitatus]